MLPITGSTVIIVVPLHTIEAQLVLECERLGIPGWKSGNLEILQLEKVTANLPQISPKHFEASMASRPKLLVCLVEYLANSQVDVDHPICQFFNFFSGTEPDSEDSTLTIWNSLHRHR